MLTPIQTSFESGRIEKPKCNVSKYASVILVLQFNQLPHDVSTDDVDDAKYDSDRLWVYPNIKKANVCFQGALVEVKFCIRGVSVSHMLGCIGADIIFIVHCLIN